MEHGERTFEAAINSAKEISFTILAMTISLAAVFIPLVFMTGLVGRIFREFAITIIVAIFASGLVSLTLTPLMCARMLKRTRTGFQADVGRKGDWKDGEASSRVLWQITLVVSATSMGIAVDLGCLSCRHNRSIYSYTEDIPPSRGQQFYLGRSDSSRRLVTRADASIAGRRR